MIFDQLGVPTILINEHINAFENFERPYYHQSTDTLDHMDVPYGVSVARVAIETLAKFAQ